MIDWAAVEYVLQGKSMRLTLDEQRMVVRRARIVPSIDEHLPMAVTTQRLAQRMGTTADAVGQIVRRLPKADQDQCPQCAERIWVLEDGRIEEHGNRFMVRCGMSEQTV